MVEDGVQTTAMKIGDIVRVPCSTCQTTTRHELLKGVMQEGVFEGIGYYEESTIVQCLGCEQVCFRRVEYSDDRMGYDNQTNDVYYEKRVTLFPPRIAGRAAIDGIWELPYTVRRVYTETTLAMANSQPVLAGIGREAPQEVIRHFSRCLSRSQ